MTGIGTDMRTDKTMTAQDVVSRLSSGMTIGIGGWGSRRKPMALVRALLRSGITDLTVVSYGGPDVGLLAAAARSANWSRPSPRSTRSRSNPTSGRPASAARSS